MKRKCFTLIELLAVIVVLAIIALIATPIVMNTIKNAKKGAAERTADNYIKQVETTIAEKKLENNPLADGPYTIDSNGNLTGNGLTEPVTIDMNGTKPSGGTLTISNGGVSKEGTTMTVGDYNVRYNQEKNKYEATGKETSSTEVLCKANTEKVTALIWAGNAVPSEESSYIREEVGLLASEATSKYDVGVTYTCELEDGEENTFYVLETNGDNVSLIAGMNLGATVAWVTKEDYLAAGGTESDYGSHGNNNLGPVTVNKVLKEGTASWTKLDESQIKLPSGQQIATAEEIQKGQKAIILEQNYQNGCIVIQNLQQEHGDIGHHPLMCLMLDTLGPCAMKAVLTTTSSAIRASMVFVLL